MSMLRIIQKPLGIVLPMDEVKRRVIVDALDKCRGDRILAAHLLGIGKTTLYRMARTYHYQGPEAQAEALMTVPPLRRGQPLERMSTGDRFTEPAGLRRGLPEIVASQQPKLRHASDRRDNYTENAS
jgi:hypothetical protein